MRERRHSVQLLGALAGGDKLHRKQPLLPVEFVISEDGYRTFRRCQLVWRELILVVPSLSSTRAEP